jgi:Tol biopolymer transport system component
MIAFTRREGDSFWVCRSSLVGSEVRKLAAGMSPEWSPDGKHIAFVHGDSVWTMDPDGSNARELQKLHTVNGFIHSVRWSPNGAWIAVEWQGGGLTAENIRFELISTDGTQVVPVKPGLPGGELSAVAWLGNEQVIYSRSYSEGSTGAVNSASSRLIRQQIPSGATRALLWVPGGVRTVEPLGPGRLVLDSVITRENLRELTLKNGKYTGVDQWITHGSSIDRQPRASPDGRWVVFSSNRSGNLDLWEASRDGTIRRITDDPSNDWDPGFAPDGKLVWASHRSGNFEIWMAEADGSGAHQVSHDGVDAENPTVTRDGWVIYNSGSKQPGLWRVREDGSQAKRIVPGVTNWPEVSPDGQYVMATGIRQGGFIGGRRQDAGYVAVYRIADGQEVARITLKASRVNAPGVGRARWMPDGKSIVFIDAEENGVAGIYRQDFVAGKDTAGSRILVMSNPDRQPETLGVSPDGTRIMYGVIDVQSNLLLVDGIRGIGK